MAWQREIQKTTSLVRPMADMRIKHPTVTASTSQKGDEVPEAAGDATPEVSHRGGG